MNTEFLVSWKRVGRRPKKKAFRSRRAADKFMLLLGPEPWKYFGDHADRRFCCNGDMCGCGGVTYREDAIGRRRNIAAVEWLAVSVRSVSPWVEESRTVLPPPNSPDGATLEPVAKIIW